jgi:hypothetical protein
MRERTGKAARLTGVAFDADAVNTVHDKKAEVEEEKLHDQAVETHEADAKA